MNRIVPSLLLLVGSGLPALAYAQEAPVADEEALPAEEEALPAEEEAQPAEEAAPAPPRVETGATGNEIVVTAAKREQTLQQVPIAVSVAGSDAIERAQVRDLKDLQTLVPALRVSQQQNSAATNFIIRGFGNGSNNPGIEPSVGVFVDGVYRSRAAAQIADLPDVNRVEVLRGPQSILFGKNASAGVISLVTREPQFRWQGSLEATYGNLDGVVLKGLINAPLGNKVAASLAAGINKRDGFVRDLGWNGRSNDRDRWFTRAQLRFEPADALKFRLIADYDMIDEVCCAVVNLQRSAATDAIELLGGRVNDLRIPFADLAFSNFASSNRIENWGISGQADYHLGPLNITSISAWRESRALTAQDSDFTSADLIGANSGDIKSRTFTQELRANFGLMDVFNLMVGGYYFDERVRYRNTLTFGSQMRPYADLLSAGGVSTLEAGLPVAPGTLFGEGQGIFDDFAMDNTSWSVFGAIDFKVRPAITLTLGGNYTRDGKNVTSASVSTDSFTALDLASFGPAAAALRPYQFFPPFLNIPNAVEKGSTRDGKFTWTARIAAEIAPGINAYFSRATGFKASSFNLSRDSRPPASAFPDLANAGLLLTNLTDGSRSAGPENSAVWELGIRGNWTVVSANLTLFKQSVAGFQSNIFTGTGFALANAGQQSTMGIEFEGQATPTPELSFSMALVYLDPKYDSFVNSPFGDASGRRPAGVPALSATLGAQWNRKLASGDRIVARTDFHYEAPVQAVEGLPGFVLRDSSGAVISYQPALDAARPFRREVDELSASLSYVHRSGIELSLWGRNLLDDRYVLTVFDSVAQAGSISGYPSQPRTYGLTARFKW